MLICVSLPQRLPNFLHVLPSKNNYHEIFVSLTCKICSDSIECLPKFYCCGTVLITAVNDMVHLL